MSLCKDDADALPQFKELSIEKLILQINSALADYAFVISKVKREPQFNWDTSIQPLEEAAERLGKIWGLMEHLNSVAKTTELRNAYESILPKVSNFHTEIMQDVDLFRLFVNYRATADFNTLSVAQQTIIDNEIRSFNLSGVDLNVTERESYKGYVERLSEIENQFANNVLDATDSWIVHIAANEGDKIAGLPAHTLEYAKQKAHERKLNGWILTLDYSCYHAIMTSSLNQELRQTFYHAYNTRAASGKLDNTHNIAEILTLRHDIARTIGYKNYAQFSLIPKSAESVMEVNIFLQNLVTKVKPIARNEFNDLVAYAQSKGLQGELQAWDITFYAEMQRKELYGISEEEFREYFPEPRVLNGMFKLVHRLFGLTIEEVENCDAWHKSVHVYKVIDENNVLRGYFYSDLYSREGKEGGAWVSECTARVKFSNDYLQKPIAFLNCNFAPPTDGKPGCLSHEEVITLFHEFGHTLHHVLTQVEFFSVSGMNGVAWDAIELPSQFMENWCWEWLVMQEISENVHTGEPLPKQLFERLLASQNFHTGLRMLRQLEFSLFDLQIHGEIDQSAHEILQQIRSEISVVPLPEFNRFENSFTHIFGGGYAAGYYSYLWAEVLACDAFAKFKASGVINTKLGRSFMENILEQGGSRPAMELYIAFAGSKPAVDALLEHHGIAQK